MTRLQRRVLASGVFDVLHPGHIKYLNYARRLAGDHGKLIVVIARDETVRKNKGKKPIFGENDRAFIVSSLKPVDQVVLGHNPTDLENSFRRMILETDPDIIALGYDQVKVANLARKVLNDLAGKKIALVKIRRFQSKGLRKSSEIKKRIVHNCAKSLGNSGT